MPKAVVLCVVLGLAAPVFPATAQTSKTPQHTAKKAPARKKAAGTKAAAPSRKKATGTRTAAPARKKKPGKKTARSKVKPQVPGWRMGQQAPTRERYAEIQRALAERGYFTAAATGVWGPESVDALKRFQQDQKLEPSGKLNSLSLIALGLGPSRDSSAPPPAKAPQQPQ